MSRNSNTRTPILQAAIEEIRQAGSGNLRVDGVATRAGVNKRMIYHHFKDRQGLLAGALRTLSWMAERQNLPGHKIFASAFGRDDSEVPVRLGNSELLRVLVAEYCREPRTDSEDLLRVFADDPRRVEESKPAQVKPRYRVAAVSRPTSPVVESP